MQETKKYLIITNKILQHLWSVSDSDSSDPYHLPYHNPFGVNDNSVRPNPSLGPDRSKWNFPSNRRDPGTSREVSPVILRKELVDNTSSATMYLLWNMSRRVHHS